MDAERVWAASIIGRIFMNLSRWGRESLTWRLVTRAAARLSAAWKGSLLGRLLQADLCGIRALEGSRVAAAFAAGGRWAERGAARWAGFFWQAAAGSYFGQVLKEIAGRAREGGTSFWSGAALGAGLGIVVFGLARGGLTPARQAAAGILAAAAVLLWAGAGDPARWLETSLLVRFGRWLLELGNEEESCDEKHFSK